MSGVRVEWWETAREESARQFGRRWWKWYAVPRVAKKAAPLLLAAAGLAVVAGLLWAAAQHVTVPGIGADWALVLRYIAGGLLALVAVRVIIGLLGSAGWVGVHPSASRPVPVLMTVGVVALAAVVFLIL